VKLLKRVTVSIAAIAISFLIGFLFIKWQGNSPVQAFKALYSYGIGSWFSFASTLNAATPLILTGISAAIAFGSGVVNLGQHGQFLMGAIVAALLGAYLNLPGWLGITVIVLCGGIAGALWAGIAALLKKLYSMDEFISTLMLNFVSEYLTLYLATYPFLDPKAYVPATKVIQRSYFMHSFGMLNMSFLVAVVIAFLSYWFMRNLKIGYEFRMMGYNAVFAKTGGCAVEKNTHLVLLYTGFLSGLAGALLILGGTQHRFMKGIGANFGWDGVMLAIIADNGILETLFYAIFFGFLKTGGIGMEFETSVPSEFILVLQAVIVMIVVGSRSAIDYFGDRIRARFTVRKVVTD